MNRYDLADRHAHGTGPAPRTFQVARDPAIPRADLGESAVCGSCGAVYRSSQMHACKPRKATS